MDTPLPFIYAVSMDERTKKSLSFEARQFATGVRIVHLVKTETTMDLGIYSDQSFQNLCEEIRGRFVRLVLRGSGIDDATIVEAVSRKPFATPKRGGKSHGKPGWSEKKAKGSD